MKTAAVLGIETSGTASGVALAAAGRVLHREVREGGRHNEVLLGLIDQVLRSGSMKLEQLAGIGVVIGPGMFTSLRVGLSVAKAICLAKNLPLKGILTLPALARTAGAPGRPVLCAIDARKRQVYAALYQNDSALLEPLVAKPEELPGLVQPAVGPESALLVAGDGTELCIPHLTGAGLKPEPARVQHPDPGTVALMAGQALAGQGGDNIETLVPVYLRRTDAELQREKAN